ncbi:MAG TPA: hypothetical protein VI248_24310 [Kineosporiaceae bacterium]
MRVIAWGAVVVLAATGVTGASAWVDQVDRGPSPGQPPVPTALRTDTVVDAPAAEPPPPGDAAGPVDPSGPGPSASGAGTVPADQAVAGVPPVDQPPADTPAPAGYGPE